MGKGLETADLTPKNECQTPPPPKSSLAGMYKKICDEHQ